MEIDLSDIESGKVALCHLMLTDKDVSKLVASTPQWKTEDSKDARVNVTVQFNGIEAPPEILERLLTEWYESIENHYKDKYSDIEKLVSGRVDEEVNAIVEEKIRPYAKKLQDAVDVIDNLPFIQTANDWKNI